MTHDNPPHLRTRLEPTEITQLEDQGYFLCGRVLTDDEVAEARREVDRAVEEYTKKIAARKDQLHSHLRRLLPKTRDTSPSIGYCRVCARSRSCALFESLALQAGG